MSRLRELSLAQAVESLNELLLTPAVDNLKELPLALASGLNSVNDPGFSPMVL